MDSNKKTMENIASFNYSIQNSRAQLVLFFFQFHTAFAVKIVIGKQFF